MKKIYILAVLFLTVFLIACQKPSARQQFVKIIKNPKKSEYYSKSKEEAVRAVTQKFDIIFQEAYRKPLDPEEDVLTPEEDVSGIRKKLHALGAKSMLNQLDYANNTKKVLLRIPKEELDSLNFMNYVETTVSLAAFSGKLKSLDERIDAIIKEPVEGIPPQSIKIKNAPGKLDVTGGLNLAKAVALRHIVGEYKTEEEKSKTVMFLAALDYYIAKEAQNPTQGFTLNKSLLDEIEEIGKENGFHKKDMSKYSLAVKLDPQIEINVTKPLPKPQINSGRKK